MNNSDFVTLQELARMLGKEQDLASALDESRETVANHLAGYLKNASDFEISQTMSVLVKMMDTAFVLSFHKSLIQSNLVKKVEEDNERTI